MVIPAIGTGTPILWPALIKSIKNWVQANFIVRPGLDRSFTLHTFGVGAKQAFLTVSDRIADGDTDSLKGLVTNDVLDSIKKTLPKMSMSDREFIRRDESDIYFNFPYELGIILDDKNPSNRWVEIMMVYHTLRGYKDLQRDNVSVKDLQQNAEKFLFANIRFSRNYSKNIQPEESEWVVNYLNYFNPQLGEVPKPESTS